MIDQLIKYIAPHHCYSCGKVGTILCDNCQFNIINESYDVCISCLKPSLRGVCNDCKTMPYQQAWVVGERSDELEKMINDFKFHRVKQALYVSAVLLDHTLPHFSSEVHIVPIPTIPKHIRLRGYNHMNVIAKSLAKKRNHHVCHMLVRKHRSVQVGASSKLRQEQAKHAFKATKKCDPAIPHLIIDDVVTTGATLQYSAEAMKKAGVITIWVAAVARTPRENINADLKIP